MTDRGLPNEGASACPFIAFDDDRDVRSSVPDHRHRCYAEVRPANPSNAHQDAFCLSSAFPACPTFLDWARREAAAARTPAASSIPTPAPAPIVAPPPRGPVYPDQDLPLPQAYRPPTMPPDPGATTAAGTNYYGSSRRDWAAPPPWARDGNPPAPVAPPAPPPRPPADAGLAASAAAWLGEPEQDSATVPEAPPPSTWRTNLGQPAGTPSAGVPLDRSRAATSRAAPSRGATSRDPGWEEPRRADAFPPLRTRVGLPFPSASPVTLWFIALLGAGVFLFFVPPMLLRMGSTGGATPTPAPMASASPVASVEPTPEPSPTPRRYVVAGGDTMSRVAGRFGISLEQLLAANPAITDPDKVVIGDELVIPTPLPEAVPDGGDGGGAPVVVDDPSASLAPAP